MNIFVSPEWTSDLAVGVDKWDAEHRQLFMLLAEIVRMVNHDSDDLQFEVARYLRFLVSYVDFHFKSEELAMESLNYPAREQHVQEHRYFSAWLDDVTSQYNHDPQAVDVIGMVEFLTKWLRTHIGKSDQDYRQFFEQHADELKRLGQREPLFAHRLECS